LLARIASDPKVETRARREAVAALGDFAAPQPRDRLTGSYRPLPKQVRDSKAAVAELKGALAKLLIRKQPDVFLTTAKAAARLKLIEAAPFLARAVEQKWDTDTMRLEALKALQALKAPELDTVLPIASKDPSSQVRLWALKARVVANPALGHELVAQALKTGTIEEKQAAIGILGWLQDPSAATMLLAMLDELVAGKLPPALSLDVQDAAKKRNEASHLTKLEAYEKARPDTEIAPYIEAIEGGDAEQGRRTFMFNATVQCRRCHSVEGHGAEVGPELKTVGKRRSRQYLLEAVVFPSKHFAPGFESALVTMKDGAIHGGTVKQDTPSALKLASAEEGELTLAKKEIASREPGASGMPDGFGSILSKRELRDLVAFLAAQK
jgi:quinoprotein glucose dehydrogenase